MCPIITDEIRASIRRQTAGKPFGSVIRGKETVLNYESRVVIIVDWHWNGVLMSEPMSEPMSDPFIADNLLNTFDEKKTEKIQSKRLLCKTWVKDFDRSSDGLNYFFLLLLQCSSKTSIEFKTKRDHQFNWNLIYDCRADRSLRLISTTNNSEFNSPEKSFRYLFYLFCQFWRLVSHLRRHRRNNPNTDDDKRCETAFISTTSGLWLASSSNQLIPSAVLYTRY